MPHSWGYRARTRDMFSRDFRKTGMINISTFMKPYKKGDCVDIYANSAVHKGMPHKQYHGRTGRVFNVTRRAVGVRVKKRVRGMILWKNIHIRVEHVSPSKCQDEIKNRIKVAVAASAEFKKSGGMLLRRLPFYPFSLFSLSHLSISVPLSVSLSFFFSLSPCLALSLPPLPSLPPPLSP